jgi:AraC-like DNA-binding protein
MRDAVSGEISDAIDAFLASGGIREMHVAQGSISPPAMAYLVHFPRLSIILDGEDQMEIEREGQARQLKLRAGEAVFVPANCWNKPAWTNPVKVLTLLFGKRQTGISMVCLNRPGATPKTVKTHFHRPMEGPVPGILDAMMNLPDHASDNPTGRLLSEALLHSCLKLLQEPMRNPGSKADKTFQNICMYLQENFQFELTRESVADHFRLSPNHVSRLFRSEGLMRFTDYLTWVRLDRAKYMLRHHDRTLAEVARSCGFSDISYFCRVFKARVRLTPTAYRMQKSAADIAEEKSN